MALKATSEGTCTRCNGAVNVGDEIVIYNRPRPRSIFHAKCPDEGHDVPKGEHKGEPPKAPLGYKGGQPQGLEGDDELDAPPSDDQGQGEPQDGQGEGEGEEKPGKGKGEKSPIEEIIRDIARDEVGKAKITAPQPQRIEIKPIDAPPVDVTEKHFLLPRVIRLMSAGLFPYLWGDAGTGKTTALIDAAGILGIPFELDTLDRSTPRSALLGYRTPQGEPVETQLTRVYANGGLLIHDEMDNSPAYVQSILNSALANGHCPTAWGTIARHGRFYYGAAGNTPFRPTPRFPDRLPGSFAYMDRLYFVHWPLDPNIERRVTGRPLVKPPARKPETCSAANWGEWVEATREWTRVNTPTIQVTPRATIAGLKALAAGETPLEVAHGLVFRGADEAMVGKILAANPLPRS